MIQRDNDEQVNIEFNGVYDLHVYGICIYIYITVLTLDKAREKPQANIYFKRDL